MGEILYLNSIEAEERKHVVRFPEGTQDEEERLRGFILDSIVPKPAKLKFPEEEL